MSGNFQSKLGIGERAVWMTLPCKVIAITFRENGVQYEIAFDSGGTNGFVWSDEVNPAEAVRL